MALAGKAAQEDSAVATSGLLQGTFALRWRSIWGLMRAQPASFWLVVGYLLIEYIRPQQIYEGLAVVPWAQALLVLAPIAFLLEGGQLKARNPLNFWILAFVAAVAWSSFLAVYPENSRAQWYVLINWVLAYYLVANVASTEARFCLFFLVFLLASLKMSQHGTRIWVGRGFGFSGWGASGAPGWFRNSGEFGIQMCIFLPLSLYFISALKSYWTPFKRALVMALPFTAMASIIASSSRGALLGAAAVGLWILLRTRHRVRVLLGILVAAGLVMTVLPDEFKQRFETMGDDKTSESRETYWRRGIEMFKERPMSGIGYENWTAVYEDRYGYKALPHNIFVQGGAELGMPGLLAMVGLIVASFVVNYRTRRLAASRGEDGRFLAGAARGLDGAMIGFLASGFFITVLYYPFLWFNVAMTSALHTAAQHSVARGTPALRSAEPVPRQAGWRSARIPLRPTV